MKGGVDHILSSSLSLLFIYIPTQFLFIGCGEASYCLKFLLKSQSSSYLWGWTGPTLSLSPLFVQIPLLSLTIINQPLFGTHPQLTCSHFPSIFNEQPFRDHVLSKAIKLT